MVSLDSNEIRRLSAPIPKRFKYSRSAPWGKCDNPGYLMAETNRDTDIDILQRHLTEVTRRKGPHSIIAKTLTAALRSGNDRDLSAGLFAYTHFDKYYEQLTLEESLRRVRLARPQAEQDRKEREWRETLEKETAQPRRAFGESRLPDGPDAQCRRCSPPTRSTARTSSSTKAQDTVHRTGCSDDVSLLLPPLRQQPLDHLGIGVCAIRAASICLVPR
jgi:hypothetical protein